MSQVGRDVAPGGRGQRDGGPFKLSLGSLLMLHAKSMSSHVLSPNELGGGGTRCPAGRARAAGWRGNILGVVAALDQPADDRRINLIKNRIE